MSTGRTSTPCSCASPTIWATDSTGNVIISSLDQNNYLTNSTTYSLLEFSLPVTLGNQYYLFVKNTMFLNSATAILAPDLDMLQQMMTIYTYFAQTHGDRILRDFRFHIRSA